MNSVSTKLLHGVSAAAFAIGGYLCIPIIEANAQATDKIDQGIKRGPGKRVNISAKNSFNVSSDESVLLKSLKGVVIVSSPTEVSDKGASATGVEVKADAVPDQVARAADPYVGQPVSLASLDKMTRDMVLAFRDAGMPVVNVVVPPQDVTNGVVQVIAVVGRFGDLSVSGEPANLETYTQGFPIAQGEVIEEGAVVNHLRWLSRRQNRRVDAVYSPGKEFSQTDIQLDVKETKPWSVFLGADSSGPGTSGNDRFFAGGQVNDLFVPFDELSYQFTTSEDGYDALGAHVLEYTLPIWDRTDFQITGVYVKSNDDKTLTSTDGTSQQISPTFITQLDRDPWLGMYWDARYGFDYKKSDNDFEFGGNTVYAHSTRIGQFFGQMEGELARGPHHANVYAGLWYSPGGIFSDDNDKIYTQARNGASAQYVYARAGIDYNYDFASQWTAHLRAEGQISSDRLLYSEMMYVGGINSVRGFQDSVLRGDNGYFASAELMLPGYTMDLDTVSLTLRGFGFFDFGGVNVKGTANAGEGSADISGSGVGLKFATADKNNPTAGIFGEVSYGWKVNDDKLNVTDSGNGQFHFRVITRF